MVALSRLIARHARTILIASVALTLVAGVFGGDVANRLGPYSATDPATDSVKTTDRLARATGLNVPDTLFALVTPAGPVTSAAGRARVLEVTRTLQQTPGLGAVNGPFDASGRLVRPAQVSRDGRMAYVAGRVERGAADRKVVNHVRERLPAGHDVRLGGVAALAVISNDLVQSDLKRAELLAFPLLLLLSLLFFRGLVAALIPLLVGGCATILTFLVLRLVSEVMGLSVYALNIVSALGLGLAIDWSLFMVSRYREELAARGPGLDALVATMRTAGRTIVFSALTVAAALSALLVFPQRFLYSMGLGGAAVALVAAATSVLILPALLWVLGPRVNALSPSWLRRRAEAEAGDPGRGRWYALARLVTRRPLPVAAFSVLVLVALSLPAARVHFTAASVADLPASTELRQVDIALTDRFSGTPQNEIIAVSSAAAPVRETLGARIARLSGVRSVGRWQTTGKALSTLTITPVDQPLSDRSQQLVRAIRRIGGAAHVGVGGTTAAWVDEQASLRRHLPTAFALLCVTTFLLLLGATRSVMLPLKALLMNALSLAASFGVLVLVFQDGRFEHLLGYTSLGVIESSQPLVLAAVAFGLSTDYGVFLLMRIKEARDGGASDAEAVAIGLERTGRLVTAAAALFCVAIGAIASSQAVFIKELGVGTAVAVLLDATLVRALLVPALMTLMGPWNWWAPRFARSRPAAVRSPS
jgi:RND superfamily putative drug exporter